MVASACRFSPQAQCTRAKLTLAQVAPHLGHGAGLRGRPVPAPWVFRAACILRAVFALSFLMRAQTWILVILPRSSMRNRSRFPARLRPISSIPRTAIFAHRGRSSHFGSAGHAQPASFQFVLQRARGVGVLNGAQSTESLGREQPRPPAHDTFAVLCMLSVGPGSGAVTLPRRQRASGKTRERLTVRHFVRVRRNRCKIRQRYARI